MDKTNSNVNEDLKKIELTNAFAMWRPEMLGGRPLGAAFGLYGIKQTANAAYSNIFSGDPDSDFPAYSIAALTSKPMVNVDFHISGNTGVGIAFVKGGSDLVKISAQFDEQTMMTGVFYAEAEYKNIGFNAAYQLAKGNKKEIKTTTTSTPLTEGTYDYVAFDPKYLASAVNAQLTYNLNMGVVSAKPFIGYNLEFGQEAIDPARNKDPTDARTTMAQVLTGGTTISYKAGKLPLRLSGEYSKILNDDLSLMTVANTQGQLDTTAALAGYNTFGGTAKEGIFDDISGSCVSAFSGLNGQYNLELAADVSPKVTVSLFLNGQVTKAVSSKVSAEDKKAMKAELKAAGVGVNASAGTGGLVSQDAFIDYVVDGGTAGGVLPPSAGIVGNLEGAGLAGIFDWTDTMSYGLSVTYRF